MILRKDELPKAKAEKHQYQRALPHSVLKEDAK